MVSVISRKPPAHANDFISTVNILNISSSRYNYIITPFCSQNSQGHSFNDGCALAGVPAELTRSKILKTAKNVRIKLFSINI